MTPHLNITTLENAQDVTSTLDICAVFNITHEQIILKIDEAINSLTFIYNLPYDEIKYSFGFYPFNYISESGNTKAYRLTMKALLFLSTFITSNEAIEYRITWIKTFESFLAEKGLNINQLWTLSK